MNQLQNIHHLNIQNINNSTPKFSVQTTMDFFDKPPSKKPTWQIVHVDELLPAAAVRKGQGALLKRAAVLRTPGGPFPRKKPVLKPKTNGLTVKNQKRPKNLSNFSVF